MGNRVILEMNYEEAKSFFLKSESYFNVQLPPYYNIDAILRHAKKILGDSNVKDIQNSKSSKSDLDLTTDNQLLKDVYPNLLISSNKDANYSVRVFQMIHPLLYVDLVHLITSKENWNKILERFKLFREDKRINCISLPVESIGNKTDQAEQILNWWQDLEQNQISLYLDYDYCIQTDITDCYSSIYTHTIAWAIQGKKVAKQNRNTGLGNDIDKKIQSMQNNQTNGIPTGSVLMDFIAEIVLGYADKKVADFIKKEKIVDKFQILRYRDDYRIFTKKLDLAEKLMKKITEILLSLNLKINTKKTFLCKDIITDAIKPEKLYWQTRSLNFYQKNNGKRIYNITLLNHLLEIKILGDNFPNCGRLKNALSDFFEFRISKLDIKKNKIENTLQLISVLTSIMVKNPSSIIQCVAILAKLLEFINSSNERNRIIRCIYDKFSTLPNTDYVEIWLQRITVLLDTCAGISFSNNLSKQVNELIKKEKSDIKSIELWDSRWLKSDKRINSMLFIDEAELSKLTFDTDIEEVSIFKKYQD